MHREAPRARDNTFDLVGTRYGTYRDAYNVEYRNVDHVERALMSAIFEDTWKNIHRDEQLIKLEKASCTGLERVASYSLPVLEQFFNPSYFTGTILTKADRKDYTCSICFEDFDHGDDVIATECQHVFHQQCLLSWAYGNSGTETCPGCRTPVEHLRCGKHDGATGRMLADRIRVLCAVPGYCNRWTVIQLEYEEATAQNRGHPDFKRIIADNRIWAIVKSFQNGKIFLPPDSEEPENAHPQSPRYREWHENMTRRWLFKQKSLYHTYKRRLISEFCPEINLCWEVIEGFIHNDTAQLLFGMDPSRLPPGEKASTVFHVLIEEAWPCEIVPIDWCGLIALVAAEELYWGWEIQEGLNSPQHWRTYLAMDRKLGVTGQQLDNSATIVPSCLRTDQSLRKSISKSMLRIIDCAIKKAAIACKNRSPSSLIPEYTRRQKITQDATSDMARCATAYMDIFLSLRGDFCIREELFNDF